VAHEWGHAIQARLDQSLNSQASELQADCLAGAVLYGAVRDGTLTFEEGDVKEIATALTAVSDETPWTSVADHGDPFERTGAFDQGRRGGVPACLPGAVR
jgi:predicted metalloprotease